MCICKTPEGVFIQGQQETKGTSRILYSQNQHHIEVKLLLDAYSSQYLLENSLSLLGISDSGQLHVSHLLHFLIHVNLLLQLAYLGPQQSHGILPVVLPSESSRTCRVDRCDPVLQFCLS